MIRTVGSPLKSSWGSRVGLRDSFAWWTKTATDMSQNRWVFIFHKFLHKSFHKDETLLNVFPNHKGYFLREQKCPYWKCDVLQYWTKIEIDWIMEMSPKPWKISYQSRHPLRFIVSLKRNSKRPKDTRKSVTRRVRKCETNVFSLIFQVPSYFSRPTPWTLDHNDKGPRCPP